MRWNADASYAVGLPPPWEARSPSSRDQRGRARRRPCGIRRIIARRASPLTSPGRAAAARGERAAADASTYLALREITIYFAPWLSLWEILGGFVLSPAERVLVAPAFGPANRWQALENERVSVARDARTGTPNVIALHAAERGVLLAHAAREIAARADAELAAYGAATRALRAGTPSRAVTAYLDALVAAVDGAIRHHRSADPERYAPIST